MKAQKKAETWGRGTSRAVAVRTGDGMIRVYDEDGTLCATIPTGADEREDKRNNGQY